MRLITAFIVFYIFPNPIFSQKENKKNAIANNKKIETILDKSDNPQSEIDSLIFAYNLSTNKNTKHNIAFTIGEKHWFARKTYLAEKWLLLSIENEPKPTDTNNITNALDLLTNLYLHIGKIEEANTYSEKCFAAYGQVSNKIFLGNYYQTKARIYQQLGESVASIKAFEKADSLYSISKFDDVRTNAKYVDIALAEIFFNFKRYDQAIDYYNSAINKAAETKSATGENLGMQGLAKCAFQLKQYTKAKGIYEKLIGKFTSPGKLLYTYVGLGDIADVRQNYKTALKHYQTALAIAKTSNESYIYDILYANIANIYLKMNDIKSAKINIDSALVLTKRNNNLNSQVNAYLTLTDIYKKEKKYDLALSVSEQMGVVKDSLFNKNSLALANKLYIVNKIKKKDLEISVLQKTDDLNKKYLKQGDIIKVLLGLIIAIMCLFFYNFYKKIKANRQVEEFKAIQLDRERIITDLHDDIGATLSSMQIYSELAEKEFDHKPIYSYELIGKVSGQAKNLMTRMGDIIWSLKEPTDETLSIKARLFNYYVELFETKGIKCTYNIDENIAENLNNPTIRKNIFLIIREAMNNIAKYSQAKNAKICLQKKQNIIWLTIEDDGVGFDIHTVILGNGINNIKKRVKALEGNIDFTTEKGHGTKISINFAAKA